METAKIPLVNGGFVLVDAEDVPWLSEFRWRSITNGAGKYPYAFVSARGPKRAMHRMIMKAKPGQLTDHRNHNTLDNRKANLRLCTPRENSRNRVSVGGASGFKNVTWSKIKNRWRVKMRIGGSMRSFGLFKSEEAAAKRADELARLVHGDFAYLNFPEGEQCLV